MRIVVAHKGAREHFLAARALHHRGALAKLVVDWYAPVPPRFDRAVSFLFGAKGRSAVAARSDAIPHDLICALRLLGLWWKWQERTAARRGHPYDGFDRTDGAFARRLASLNLPSHDVFFGYSYASLEMIEAENRRGRLTVVDQIDPGAVEFRLVAEEMARYPELAGLPAPFPSGHFGRARREWELADVIIVNSEWSREAIIEDGADPAKIELLPLAFEAKAEKLKAENRNQFQVSGFDISAFQSVRLLTSDLRSLERPLRVLFLGQVNVRKGIHYLLEAARLLEKETVEFLVVGPLGIRKETTALAPKNVRWLGQIPRSEASELYNQCDVFVLPTLSDGFAITQIEALAHGLPVITTPNCGQVVEHGQTGFVVPARDSQALAEAIMRFIRNRHLSSEMSPKCREAAAGFSIDAYGQRLVEIINQRMKAQVRIC